MKKITLLLPVLLLVSLPIAFSQKGKGDGKQEKVMEALPKEAFAKPKKERKLLIFSATNGYRHKSIDIGKVALAALGKQTGAYQAVVSDDLDNFEPEKIKNFDAILFLSTTQEVFLPKNFNKLGEAEKKSASEKSDRLKASLMAHIKNGAGFIGIHAATDTFYKWSEYGEMMNGYFDGHPWNAGTPVSIKVEPGQEKHPLVAHLNGENSRLQRRNLPAQSSLRFQKSKNAPPPRHRKKPHESQRHQTQRQRLRRRLDPQLGKKAAFSTAPSATTNTSTGTPKSSNTTSPASNGRSVTTTCRPSDLLLR